MAIKNIIKKASDDGNDVSKMLKSINDSNNKNTSRLIKSLKNKNNVGVINSFSPDAIKAIKSAIMPGIEARSEAKRNIFGFKKKTNPPTMKFFNNLFAKYFGESGTPTWMKALFLTLGGSFIYFFEEIKLKLLSVMKMFTAKGLFVKIAAVLKENQFITKILESLKNIKGRIGGWATKIWTSVQGIFGGGGKEGAKGKGPKWLQSLRNMKDAVGGWAKRLSASVQGIFGAGDKTAKKGPTFIEKLKGIKDSVKNFFAKLISPFKGFFGGAEKAAAIGPKKPGKVMEVLTKIMNVVKETKAGKFLKVVAKFFPFLIPILAVWETIKGITGGWKEVEEANPEASVIEKLGGAFKGGLKAIWKFFVTDLVDFIGGAAKWLVEKALGFLGFDKAAETIKKQKWNFGTKLDEWLGKAWKWIKGIFGFGEPPEKVEGEPEATETEGGKSLMGFVKSSVIKVWDWIKSLFSFTPLGLILDKLPGLDITGMLKGLAKSILGPVINYEGWGSGVVQNLIPDGLAKWINAPTKGGEGGEGAGDAGGDSTAPPKKKESGLVKQAKDVAGKMWNFGAKLFGSDEAEASEEDGISIVKGKRVSGLPIVKPLSPIKTGIDWGFISSKEGGSKLKGYVPDPDGSKSGVTIATGFDLGARGPEDIKGLSPELQAKLAPFLGLKGEKAVAALKSRGLKITAKEAKEIDKMSKGASTANLKREWNANAKKMGGKMFEDLTSAQKTVVASVGFQYGSLNETPTFRDLAQGGNWSGAADELDNFGDNYSTRRESEAAYLRNNSGQLLSQAQAQSQARVNRGAGNTTIIKGGDSSQSVHHSVGTSSHDQHAKPEEVIGQN